MFEVPKKAEDFVTPVLVLLVFFLLMRRRSERATPLDWVGERERRAPHSHGGSIQRVVAGGTHGVGGGQSILEDTGGFDDYEVSEDFADDEAGPYNGLPGIISLQPVLEEPLEEAAVPHGVYRAASERREAAAPRLMPTRAVSEIIEGRRTLPPLSQSRTTATIVGGATQIRSGSSVSQAWRSTPSNPVRRAFSTTPQPATSRTLSRAAHSANKEPNYGDEEDLGVNVGGEDNMGGEDMAIDGEEYLHPKEEPYDDDDGHLPFQAAPLSLPLPPRSETASACTRRSSTAEHGPVPLSNRLPPKGSSGSRTTSAAGSRASSAAIRRGTMTPSLSRAATPTILPSSASATVYRSQSVASSGLTALSRSSSPLSPPPDELSERWVHKSTSRTVQGGEAGDGGPGRTIVTAWFESFSLTLLDSPPNLSDHPDLQPGDLLYHRTPADYQLWIWEAGVNGIFRWVRVKFMSARNGLWLTLTSTSQKPSWVSEKHAQSRKCDLLRMGYAV